ncbi:Galactoside 3(4)-L-fucosyltransferase [Holothuria leucospilota]|uniref:Fucosyltransferase n=1 Tax=Holothuria leucospilota TaxID=206669 RepID=A0A9Q1H0T8_HOLLE|nr:Galactoside 3(4)-L-fucosyltransferase [Holothuria leucospilota]
MGYGKFGIHKYPIHCDCDGAKYLVTNESAYMQTAQIVVFTVGAQRNMTLDDWRKYHRERKQSQVWVLGTRESPQTCTAVLPPLDMGMVYNWSFTYHSKADFPTPYGGYKAFKVQQFGSTNWFSQKKNLISWTSSHCPLPASRYRRRDFVYSLKNHLNISMYGSCGDGRFDGPGYSETMKSYKFALVLENSCCSEYITEKFWDALTVYNQVPVVYGANREEYERIAPPGSFIFVQDFSSLKELAEFIEKVGNSESEYNKYHYWRRLGHAYKQNDQEDRIYHCHSICRMASKQREVEEGKTFHFDEKGEVFSGGCRQCQKEIDLVTGNVA